MIRQLLLIIPILLLCSYSTYTQPWLNENNSTLLRLTSLSDCHLALAGLPTAACVAYSQNHPFTASNGDAIQDADIQSILNQATAKNTSCGNRLKQAISKFAKQNKNSNHSLYIQCEQYLFTNYYDF